VGVFGVEGGEDDLSHRGAEISSAGDGGQWDRRGLSRLYENVPLRTR
jgi:hypothetical protein